MYEKGWLNARSKLTRRVIRELRAGGFVIPPHNCEFVVGCAAPFRGAQSVTYIQMEQVVKEMVALYVSIGRFKNETTSNPSIG